MNENQHRSQSPQSPQSPQPQPQHRFIALSVTIEVVRALRPLVAGLNRVDKDLANQIHRAASSLALNLGEGSKRTGGRQTALVPNRSGKRGRGSGSARGRGCLGGSRSARHEAHSRSARSTGGAALQAALLYRLLQPAR